MKHLFSLFVAMMILSGTAWAFDDGFDSEFGKKKQKGFMDFDSPATSRDGGFTVLPPFQRDAYGPGIYSDGTGKPFMWKPDMGAPDPLSKVKPDVYGPGIGADEYGRPVRPCAWPCQ
jgi:hypothetical protein